MKKVVLFASMSALVGCAELIPSTTVDFSDEASAAVELEIEIAGECSGSGERADDRGVTTWTKTLVADGTVCRIDVAWDGDLISLAKMRTDTVTECGPGNDRCNPDELDLSLAIRLESAWFDAGAERMEREQLVALSASASTGGAPLFALDRETPLPVELGPDPAVKAQLKQAYLAAGSLPVHAEATLDISMIDVRRLQEGAPIGLLTVGFTSELSGSIEAHL